MTGVKVFATQLCLILCDPLNCSPQGSSVHGILQARILKCVAISLSRGSSRPKDWTWVSWRSPSLQADSLLSEPLGKAQNRAKFPVYHHIQEKKKSKYLFNTHLRTKKINFPAVSEMNKNIFYKDDWKVCFPGFLNGTGKCFRKVLWRKVLATEYKLVMTLKKLILYQWINHIYTTSQNFRIGWKLLWWLSSHPLIFKQREWRFGASQVALVKRCWLPNAVDIKDMGSIAGFGRPPGGRHGNPLQYFCLENPMYREAWQAMVHTELDQRVGHYWSNLAHTHTHSL